MQNAKESIFLCLIITSQVTTYYYQLCGISIKGIQKRQANPKSEEDGIETKICILIKQSNAKFVKDHN